MARHCCSTFDAEWAEQAATLSRNVNFCVLYTFIDVCPARFVYYDVFFFIFFLEPFILRWLAQFLPYVSYAHR